MKLFEKKMRKLYRDDVINAILEEKDRWSSMLASIGEIENSAGIVSDGDLKVACKSAIRALDTLLDRVEKMGMNDD